jgi:outer membrane protein
MLKKSIYLFLGTLLFCPIWTNAQQSMTLSLQQAQEYALQNHPQIKTSQLNIADGRNTLKSRTSAGLPQVNASIGYNHFITLPTSLIPAEFFGGEPGQFAEVQFGTPDNMTAGISASQLLFNGPYLYSVQAAKVYVELLQEQSKVEATEVKKNVELAYYTVLIANEMMEMANENLRIISNTLEEVSQMNKAGFVEEIDVDRLKISQSTLQTLVNNTMRQKEFALNLLRFQMGMDMSQSISLTDSLTSMNAEMVLINNDQNFLSRPEFGVLQTTKRLNELNILANKAAYYPTLALFGSYEQAAQRTEFNFLDGSQPWFETFLVGVQLNVPIFTGMQRSAAIQTAQIGYDKVALAESTLLQAVQLEVAQYTTEYLNAKAETENQLANITLAEKIYQTALIKYKEGVGSSLELSDAERTLLNAQTAYISGLYNLLTAQTNLKKSLGYL